MTGISLLQRFKAAKAGELPRVVEQPDPQPRYNGVQRELTVSGNSVFAIRIVPDRFADLVECQLSGIGLRKLSRKDCAGLLRHVRRDVREVMRDQRYGIVACGEFSAAQAEVDRSDIATWSASVYLLRISDTPIHQRKTPEKPERFRGEPLTIQDERKAADDRWNAINGDKPEWKSDAPGWSIERIDYVDGGTVRWHLSPSGQFEIADINGKRFELYDIQGVSQLVGEFPSLALAIGYIDTWNATESDSPAPPIATIGTNNSGTSIRLSFTDKPESQILASIRDAGFRWNRTGKYWYHKDTPKNREAVERITGAGIGGADASGEAGSAELPELPKVRETSKTSPAIDTQAIAQKFRAKAEQLAPKVDHLLRPMDSNPTAKRIGQYHSRRLDGERLDRVREAFAALADLWERGIDAVPEALRDYRKPTMDALGWMAKQTKHVSNGYHGYLAETHEWKPIADLRESRIAGALRELIDPRKQEERKRELELQTKLDALRLSDIPGFFPTPDAIVDEMIERAEIEKGHHVLEPSAGIGSIADKVAEHVGRFDQITLFEVRSSLCEILEMKGFRNVQCLDFMQTGQVQLFDRILMNPPFERGQDAEHVQHAFGSLKPGGRLVAIVSAGLMFRQDRKASGFREWLEAVGGEVIDVDGSHYRSVQAFRQTGCECKMLVVDKRE